MLNRPVKPFIFGLAVAATLLAVGLLMFSSTSGLVGKELPGKAKVLFSDGSSGTAAELKGKVVLLDFWASWCEPCRMASPVVRGLYDKYHGQGFDVVGLDAGDDDELGAAAAERKRTEAPYRFGASPDLEKFVKPEGFPTFVVLDKSGRVAYQAEGFGEGSDKELAAAVERALQG